MRNVLSKSIKRSHDQNTCYRCSSPCPAIIKLLPCQKKKRIRHAPSMNDLAVETRIRYASYFLILLLLSIRSS